jgi:phage FluMu protein Com
VAIEFSCPHCHHVLRTGDDKAGLSAKCPACSEIIWVPLAGEATAAVTPPDEGGRYNLAADQSAVVPPDISSAGGIEDPTGQAAASPQIPRRRAPAEVKCPNCSAANDGTAQACRYCGSSLAGAERVAETADPSRTADVGEVFSTAWRVYTTRFGLLVGVGLLVLPLAFVAILIGTAPAVIFVKVLEEANVINRATAEVIGPLCTLPLLALALATLVIGAIKLHLNVAGGAPAGVGDLFYGFSREGLQLIPGLLLIWVMMLLSSIVVIGPMLLWPMIYLHIDQRMPLRDTLFHYYVRMHPHFGFTLLVGLVLGAIGGMLSILTYPCCIGIFLFPFVQPFKSTLAAVGYLRWSGQRAAFD